MGSDGNYVFTPKPNYSGDVPNIKYTIQEGGADQGEDGLTADANLQITINPVADKPDMGNSADVKTIEDTAIKLGLTAPKVTDNIDHNGTAGDGSDNGDNPERLGPITLSGFPEGSVLHYTDSEGTIHEIKIDGSSISFVISDGSEANNNAHIGGATGDHSLTQAEFESLTVTPPKDSGDNFDITVSVDSYEVDADGKPLVNVPPANNTTEIKVAVLAVTDAVSLNFGVDDNGNAIKEADFVLGEDDILDLTASLKAAFADLDGSEQRDITISGLPEGSIVLVGGVEHTIGANGSITINATGQTGGIDSFPKIEIKPPKDYSGDIDGVKVSLNATDTDADNPDHNSHIESKSDEVTINLNVNPVADGVTVGGASGKEDTAIKFLANVGQIDTDGSERITSFVIKGVPDGWVVRDGDSVIQPSNTYIDANGNTVHEYELKPSLNNPEQLKDAIRDISQGWLPDTLIDSMVNHIGENLDSWRSALENILNLVPTEIAQKLADAIEDSISINLNDYADWTVTAPDHSSADGNFTVDITTVDTKLDADGKPMLDADGRPITDTKEQTDVDLKVEVTPGAEIVGKDSDGDGVADLTMTGGHQYNQDLVGGKDPVQGSEDNWFAINQDGFDFAAGWHNQDGKPATGTNPDLADGGTEKTFAVLTPVLINGADGDSAIGAQFKYTDGNGNEIILTYDGKNPVEIPIEYLDSVQFMAPPNVSGEFNIGVQAKTVDTDPDTGKTDTQISGDATLEGIFIAPKADAVDSVGIGSAHGNEDSTIALHIKPSSQDPSETFNIKIGGIPVGATIIYDGHEVTLDANGNYVFDVDAPFAVENGSLVIQGFDNDKNLSIRPPHNSDADFVLNVQAQTVDTAINGDTTVTDTGDWSDAYDVNVRVDGVADEVSFDIVEKTFTEDQLGSNAGQEIKISDLIANVEMHDDDGSEVLSFRITGLPEGFDLIGQGIIFMGGEGSERVWIINQDQLANAVIKVPEHYSGKLPGTLTPVTTETGSGDSKTGETVDLNVTIKPDPESTLNTGTTGNEDDRIKLDLSADTSHGDTDEFVSGIRISVTDVDNLNGTLLFGGKTFAEAANEPNSGISIVDGKYVIDSTGVDNIYFKPAPDFAGDVNINLEYQITDKAQDGSNNSVTSDWINGNHTITVNPITDEVNLGLKGTDSVTTAGTVTIDLTLNKQGKGTDRSDNDDSEQFTQVVVEGVPDGVLLESLNIGGQTIGDVHYLGAGKWLIDINQSDYPKFNADNGAINAELNFNITNNAQSGDAAIKITVVTQDGAGNQQADNIESDSANWDVNIDVDGAGDDQSSINSNVTAKDFDATEDKPFALGDAIDATLSANDVNGNATDANFSLTLKLSAGSKVFDADGNEIPPTSVNGEPVWVLSGKGQDQLDEILRDYTVQPPENLNDNADDKFHFELGLNGYLDNGLQSESGFGSDPDDYLPIIPDSDAPTIDVSFSAAGVDGKPTANNPQEGSDIAIQVEISNDADHAPEYGDTVYLQIKDGDLAGGQLISPDGKPLETIEITDDSDNPLGLPNGIYYVSDMPADGKLDLLYKTPEGNEYKSGDLGLGVWVQGTETGAAESVLGSVDVSTIVDAINNGYDLSIGSATDTGFVVTGDENSGGNGYIALNVAGDLVDSDGSEQALFAKLDGLPNGFTLFYKDADGNYVMATNAGGGEVNSWLLPFGSDGTLPELFIKPPQNWSGTVSDINISVLSGEKGNETWGSDQKFDLVVNPVADGVLSVQSERAFGTEGELIQLNLNVSLKDDQPANETDQYVERVQLTLTGLGENTSFYLPGVDGLQIYENVIYDADTDTYTITGLTTEQLRDLGFIQGIGSNDADGSKEITFTVGTVEVDKNTGEVFGDPSDTENGKFDFAVTVQKPTSGDDIIIGTDNHDEIHGGAGNDTIIGGAGNDTLWGGAGDDVFVWSLGDQGTTDQPAIDTIMDFGIGAGDLNGKDQIDLRDLLQGVDENADLSQYLNISGAGEKTIINISTEGDVANSHDQQIIIDNVNLTNDFDGDQSALITQLIQQGKLNVDN